MERLLALFTLGIFCTVASYSYGTISRPDRVWPNDKSAIIASIFNIEPEEIDKPIKIFGK